MRGKFFRDYRNATPGSRLVSHDSCPDVPPLLSCANRFSTLLSGFLSIPEEIINRVVKDHLESDDKSANAVENQGFQHRNADWNDRLQMHQGKPEKEFDFRT